MPNAQFRLGALSLLFLLALGSNLSRGATGQDSLGGASMIFIERPKNLTVQSKAMRPKAQQATQANPAAAAATDKEKPSAKADLSDDMEDALALGNSARDAEPPPYQDAEKAYAGGEVEF